MSLSVRMKRTLAALCSVLLLTMTTLPAQAAMIGTDRVLDNATLAADRAELVSMLEREDVQEQLQAMGVDPAAAQDRVARMTDAEVAQLNDRIGELPAGQDALGVILIVFLVFVITDVIGATDIFPFINSVD